MKKQEFLDSLYDKIDKLIEEEINNFEKEGNEKVSFQEIDHVITALVDKFLQEKIRAYVAYLMQKDRKNEDCYG